MKLKIIQGMILNPLSPNRCDFFPEGLLVLKYSTQQKIWLVQKLLKNQSEWSNYSKSLQKKIKTVQWIDYSKNVIIPGMVDIHFHWVQDDVRMMPKDSLMEWLKNYTWPFEAKFKSKSWSRDKAKEFFSELPFQGTLAGAIYSSLHPQTVEYAQRYKKGHFVVGNPLMTMHSPDYLTHSEEVAWKEASSLANKFGKSYAFTPRFAPTTTPSLMKKGKELRRKFNCFIQTHLSENQDEIRFVLETFHQYREFKNVKSYTEIYHRCHLLGPTTIMGHAIHLDSSEWKLLRQTKTAIAHCPTSNAPIKELGLGSGLFDFEKANQEKVRWALASDIGGGPYLCMFDVMRSFVQQNKKRKLANYVHAFFRATMAGAEILQMQKSIGNFMQGKEANFLVLKAPSGKNKNAENILKAICEGRPRAKLYEQIQDVFLKGQKLRRQKK